VPFLKVRKSLQYGRLSEIKFNFCMYIVAKNVRLNSVLIGICFQFVFVTGIFFDRWVKLAPSIVASNHIDSIIYFFLR